MPTINLTTPQTRFFDLECKFPLFTAGFGAGKTETLIVCAFRDLFENPGADVALYSPTYDLLKLNLAPRIVSYLEEMRVSYDYNKTDHIISIMGLGKFVMRSMDRPERIISYEVFSSHVDEIDTLKHHNADDVWNKILGRNRQSIGNKLNRVYAYSTPEGFGFTYNRWSINGGGDYQYITAPSYSNPHLPDGFIDSLYSTYPPGLVDAYIEGKWVNMVSGSVYPNFDRKLNHAVTEIKPRETLHVGMDFNVYHGAAVICVIRNDRPFVVDEIVGSVDTPDTINILKNRYPNYPVIVYPDSSGSNRSSRSAESSDIQLLRQADLTVNVRKKNPRINDRVNYVNSMICNSSDERKLYIDIDHCPFLVLALEQQAYDKNGLPDKANGHDHILDALGYFISTKYPLFRASISLLG